MDILDIGVLVLLAIAAMYGWRLGAAVQVLTFGGFLVGLGIASLVVVAVEPHVRGGLAKTLVAAGIVLASATLLAGIGRKAGFAASDLLRRIRPMGHLDSALGTAAAVAGTLVVCWLFASILVDTPFTGLSQQIEQSRIITQVESVMPPVPNQFSAIDRYLTRNGFPQVLVNALPQPTGPIRLPAAAVVREAASLDEASTVKVIANGCPGIVLEGSGFVTTGGLVVTNAHVIAGTTSITVQLPGAAPVAATPVLFDPYLDIAVLRPSVHLAARPLVLDPLDAERGDPAVVLGYPGGGPLTEGGASIASRFVAEGRDIYDESLTYRVVYEIEAIVRPGNSGGPLVSPSGEVVGVVFSRSTTSPTIGYALASPRVLVKVEDAEHLSARVATDSCIN